MQTRCHFCRRELETLYITLIDREEPERELTKVVWADTSIGRIGVCSVCYEERLFDGLTSADIAALHYSFGSPYQEEADYRVAIERLKLAFELSPCPEVEGALGYAYWKLGRNRMAVRRCLSSITEQANHFGASKAFYVLKRVYPGIQKFTAQLRTEGCHIKSVAAEFPGQRIKKPKLKHA